MNGRTGESVNRLSVSSGAVWTMGRDGLIVPGYEQVIRPSDNICHLPRLKMDASFDGRPVRFQLESGHVVLIDPLGLDGLSEQLAQVGQLPESERFAAAPL